MKKFFGLLTDVEIVVRIKKGDESGLQYLYNKYYKMMVNMIVKNNGTEEEAKDIFQDALIVLWQKIISEQLVLTSKISTYLYSICQNLWRKELERKKKIINEEVDENKVSFTPSNESEKNEIINKCLNLLGDTCRKILMYYYYDGMSMQNIAIKLGFANADTAKTKKYKCKIELDELIKSKYSESDFLD